MAGLASLPLFHRVAGQPVLVLGEGAAAEPKRRLVERAGAKVLTEIAEAVDRGARLAFVAHDDAAMCEADAIRLRCAGLLVNVVDRPDLCDFTTPSILDRDPVLIAVGTGGASAGLAKQLRLRLETLLPDRLGALASGLFRAREAIRARWPDSAARRRALDAALGPGGPLDPLHPASPDRIDGWLADECGDGIAATRITLVLASDDPDALTLRQAQLLGTADVILHHADVAPAILDRARADARRVTLPYDGPDPAGLVLVIERA